MEEIEKLAEKFVNLTVKEVNELINFLKKKYGIEPANLAFSGTSSEQKVDQKVEKSVFDIVIKSIGVSKLKLIKLVKEITGKTLTESKDLVESAPNGVVKNDVGKEEAEKIKKKLEEAGAEVELL
ncbi:MAG TPA: 50S ribosomal protein L7/L12 [Candidatus Angelobacter sp.]|jgi:large subunit ribosomal protein L7/L12|nr:50S ribosomal protein L7/L12 [Candidatus Angelobacter sp.]